jgi:hypothetical protein
MFLAAPAFGCPVCVTQPLKFAFQESTLFFLGEVTTKTEWTATFQVIEQFKGDPVSTVTLQTSSSCSSVPFENGAMYLVEATPAINGGLYAYCGGYTGSVEHRQGELGLVRSRAKWWRSSVSHISWYRFLHFVGRVLGG